MLTLVCVCLSLSVNRLNHFYLRITTAFKGICFDAKTAGNLKDFLGGSLF